MVNQIKKAAKWLLPPIMLLPLRPGHRDSRDEPSFWCWRGTERVGVQTVPLSIYSASYARRLLAGGLQAALAPACRIIYRFAAQAVISIIVDEEVAHRCGMLQREYA